jgi:2'-5' RNA ligase
MKKFTEIINEAATHDYGCVMIKFNIPNWTKIIQEINKDDIYDEEGYGLEHESHITLLYGYPKEIKVKDIKNIIGNLDNFYIELQETSLFQNEKYDVLKFDIKCEILHILNDSLKQLPNSSSYSEYHPHITISYIKKGKGVMYLKKYDEIIVAQPSEIVYSLPTGTSQKKQITLFKFKY